MNIKNFIRKMKKRFNLFWKAMDRYSLMVIMERGVPPIYYLLYDEEEIVEWQLETIRQVREILKEGEEDENSTPED